MRTMAKRALGAAAAVVTALGALGAGSGATAFAAAKQPVQPEQATLYQYHWAHFVVNGKTVAVAPFIVKDGQAYWPVQYVVKALNAAGFYAFWDSTFHTLALVTGRNLSNQGFQWSNEGNVMLWAYGNNFDLSTHASAFSATDPTNHQTTMFIPEGMLRSWVDHAAYQQITDDWNPKSGVWSLTIQAPSGLTADHIPIPPDPNDPLPKKALQFYRSIKVSVEGKYRVMAIPFYPMHSSPYWWITGEAREFNGQSDLQYSLDGGRTWHKSRNYDNNDDTQGGVKSLPAGVKNVLIRGPITDRMDVEVTQLLPYGQEGLGELVLYPSGKQVLTTFMFKSVHPPTSSSK